MPAACLGRLGSVRPWQVPSMRAMIRRAWLGAPAPPIAGRRCDGGDGGMADGLERERAARCERG
eukprot:5625332-Pyramimonas_sp.AAC.1